MLKKTLCSLTVAVTFTCFSHAQTLYAPGTVGSSTNSHVGIGTNNPQASLDVRGNLVLERNNNPYLFTGTGSSELNRYLLLLNSPSHASASGLKVGGILVSDSYAYGNPGKNDLIVKGSIGIGTTTLRNKLEVGTAFSFHDGGHKVIGFGWAPGYGDYAINTGYPAEIRYDPTGSLRFGISNQSIEAGSVMSGMNGWMLVLNKNGNVGVGSSDPQGKMEVFDNRVHLNAHEANSLIIRSPYVGSTNDKRMVGMTLSLDTPERQHNTSQKSAGVFVQSTSSWGNNVDMLFYTSNLSFQERMRITSTGNVGIGTANPGSYKLAVEGKIGAHEIKVTTSGWADFVFKDDYVLRPLAEVEQFIKDKGHLPDVPSEAEVLENGIELGAMDAKLLQKIEELTLYTIEQEKELEAHQNQLKLKSQRIDELESRLLQLEEIVRSLSKEK